MSLMMELGVEHHKMKEIKSDHDTIEAQKREALEYWLKQTPDGSWNDIINALRAIKETTLAKELAKEYQWEEPRVCCKFSFLCKH